MKTIQQVSDETLKIENFLKSQNPGTVIPYVEIENSTGVKMDNRGKGFLRTALKRAKLLHLCMKGKGIELASPGSTMTIATDRIVRIDKAVRRGRKDTNNLYDQFSETLPEVEKQRLGQIKSFFKMVEIQTQKTKALHKGITGITEKIPELPENV